jgi:glycosyltransferase involved in cell wall biosynthesis
MSQKEPAGFSIVVCTYNGKTKLLPTLKHLAALFIPEAYAAELLVIDNASTDGTPKFVEELWQELKQPYPLRVIQEKRPGKGYAVETGYDAATYSYIVTVDDDNWLDSQYLQNALALFQKDPTIGILQGISEGVFETDPPEWISGFKHLFIIGAPIGKVGYFPQGNHYVWGAGLILLKSDWSYLRELGFEFLTSKVPGKAAGEDTELGLALSLLGRKIYYSDTLRYQHYMPTARMQWKTLKKNFEVFGYVGYYMYLYSVAKESSEAKQPISNYVLKIKFLKRWALLFENMTAKHFAYYLFVHKKEYYQLLITDYASRLKWFVKLSDTGLSDIDRLQKWMIPLLEKSSR